MSLSAVQCTQVAQYPAHSPLAKTGQTRHVANRALSSDASAQLSPLKDRVPSPNLKSRRNPRATGLLRSRRTPLLTGHRTQPKPSLVGPWTQELQLKPHQLLLAQAAHAAPTTPASEELISSVDPPVSIVDPAASPAYLSPDLVDPLSPAPSATPLSTVVAESEEERRACAAMRAQLLYPYSIPLTSAPPALAYRDTDVMSSVLNQLDSRTKAEYSRDGTLKQLGLPVLSFLVLSSSDQVTEDSKLRQAQVMEASHPALKSLLVGPELSLPLARRSLWHQWQNTNPKHVQQQQHEMMLLHNGVGSKVLALATLDLQLPSGPGDLPLGPSESMRLRKLEQQRHSFPDKFSTWLGNGNGGLQLKEPTSVVAEEETLRGGYIFNLCVAQLFRRQGIARKLLCHVAAYARDVQKLDCLRMHAEVSNKAAMYLYSSLGFEIEYKETEQEAALLRRPRRVLFRMNF